MTMTANSEARKRHEALFPEPQWSGTEPMCCEKHASVLTALRKVFGSADLMEAQALADALEDEGMLA